MVSEGIVTTNELNRSMNHSSFLPNHMSVTGIPTTEAPRLLKLLCQTCPEFVKDGVYTSKKEAYECLVKLVKEYPRKYVKSFLPAPKLGDIHPPIIGVQVNFTDGSMTFMSYQVICD